MASGALASIGTLRELPLVRIGLMAIGTFREGNRLLEVPASVTLNASHCRMFSEKREFGFGVIKFLTQSRRKFLPATGVVAGLAGLSKGAVVRIAVAIGTLPKRNACVAGLVVWARRVALFARDLRMQAGQWITRFGVIELLGADRLPVRGVVALRAVVAETALVRVLMTTDARLREAKEGAVQVFDLDVGALVWRDSVRRMALLAGKSGVLSL